MSKSTRIKLEPEDESNCNLGTVFESIETYVPCLVSFQAEFKTEQYSESLKENTTSLKFENEQLSESSEESTTPPNFNGERQWMSARLNAQKHVSKPYHPGWGIQRSESRRETFQRHREFALARHSTHCAITPPLTGRDSLASRRSVALLECAPYVGPEGLPELSQHRCYGLMAHSRDTSLCLLALENQSSQTVPLEFRKGCCAKYARLAFSLMEETAPRKKPSPEPGIKGRDDGKKTQASVRKVEPPVQRRMLRSGRVPKRHKRFTKPQRMPSTPPSW